MNYKLGVYFLGIWMLTSCSTATHTAQEVVDKAIEASGTAQLQNGQATFSFRNMDYLFERKNGRYIYTRIQKDSSGVEVKDVLTNDGLIRYTDNQETVITREKRAAYTSSVNSVMYFAFLPLWLNDDAVQKEYVGKVEILGKEYHKIKVTFNKESGGEDFEDVFYYWFDIKDYSMDYIAYSYNEDDGIGIRFRVAYNTRQINGVTIQDYKNMKPAIKASMDVLRTDKAFENGELTELSLIELNNMNIILNQ